MAKFNAKQLFICENPSMSARKPTLEALNEVQRLSALLYAAVMSSQFVWTSKIPTGATDGYYIYLNEEFFRSLTNDERAFLLAHEAMHILLFHCQRGKRYKLRGFFRKLARKVIPWIPKLYNIDADAYINRYLIQLGFTMIEGGILFDDLVDVEGVFVDDLYASRDWPDEDDSDTDSGDDDGDNKPDHSNDIDGDDDDDQSGDDESDESNDDDGDSESGDGESDDDESGDDESGDDGDSSGGSDDDEAGDDEAGDGSGASDPLDGSTSEGHDTHLVPQYDGDDIESQMAEDETNMEDIVQRAIDTYNDQKDNGEHNQKSIPDAVSANSRVGVEQNASQTDWRAALGAYLTMSGGGDESTYSRIHRRRLMATGLICPTRKGTIRLPAITIDTSWSVQQYEARVDTFIAECASLLDVINPTEGAVIIHCGHTVENVFTVSSGQELLDAEIAMGGGTRMCSAVEYLDENGIVPDVHIIFTDGEMMPNDFESCKQAGAILVLVARPNPMYWEWLQISGIEYIMACDDAMESIKR